MAISDGRHTSTVTQHYKLAREDCLHMNVARIPVLCHRVTCDHVRLHHVGREESRNALYSSVQSVQMVLRPLMGGVRCGSMVRAFAHGVMVDPLNYFSFQPVLHDWCHRGRGMCYPVCGMMHIKELLLLIRKSSLWWW